jgi:hypothetical protein
VISGQAFEPNHKKHHGPCLATREVQNTQQ